MAIKYLDDNSSDGTVLGQTSASLVGFYGKAPIDQPVLTAPNTATATTTINELQIARLRTVLVSLGLMRTT
jgi:hypothetical protein